MNAQQLKNAILQEAIEGRLVPQDPNDEPASALLDRIRKEKARLVKEGKLKKKDLEEIPITEDEKPFEIPSGWEWVRWGMLGEYKKGPFGSSLTKSMFVSKSDKAVKVYEQKNAIQKDYSLGDYYISEEKYGTMTGFTVRPGDIIVSCAGTIGETYLLPPNAPVGIINQALMRARIHLDSIIPYWLLNFRYILHIENKLKGSGSAIKNIPPFEVLKAMPVPLPPLAEQQRIVAKIEELLPKVKEYGKAQEALDKLNAELSERLKKSILQEAIEGRLVPQNPNDEPASALLDRIRKEKAQLVKEGKLKKKDLDESPIAEDEKPFEIPESWEWVRLGEITYNHGQKIPTNDFSYIDIGSLDNKHQCLNLNDNIISAKNAPSRARKIVQIGDIIYATVRPYLHNICIIDRGFSKEPIASTGFAVLSCINGLFNKFLFYYLLSPVFDAYANDGENSKGVAYPAINDKKLYNGLVPLPPLAEQHRIVAKIEELLGAINALS